MDNAKNDLYYVHKIQEDLAFIMKHMKDVDVKEFERNELLQDSMMFRLIQISENSKKLSDSFKLVEHPVIPWTAIYGVNYSAIELPEHRVGTA